MELTAKAKERMTELADYIEQMEHFEAGIPFELPDTGMAPAKESPMFCMSIWKEQIDCRTACCIGGSTVDLFGEQPEEAFGITNKQKTTLCYPNIYNWDRITPEIAANALRQLAKGEIALNAKFWPTIIEQTTAL